MQRASASTPLASPPSFAGMLAELAAPGTKRPPSRDFDGLEDDIASLSYEQALRNHARVQPQPAPAVVPHAPAPAQRNLFSPEAAEARATQAERKAASITIRMSSAECEQLRSRAAEAGMTVSSYLRSCAFEVESLRAEVKQTVAQLRTSSLKPQRRPLWRWLARG